MTEADWLTCTDPRPMWHHLLHGPNRARASRRKHRLFECACYRRVWDLLTDERSRRAVEVSERYADCAATEEELDAAAAQAYAARAACRETLRGLAANAALAAARPNPFQLAAAGNAAVLAGHLVVVAHRSVAWSATLVARRAAEELEQRWQSEVFRDVFGNPFRALPVVLQSWRTSAVLALARSIYDDRRFEDLPILADALEEAGCTEARILDYLRGPGRHARGCWPVDSLLGRE